ncbi:MAG: fumarylacetoacetase [Ardenticatenaceae bacterium]|nr:fumarylacetoacetase [Ardenticatenaceae bacterium]
MFSSYIEIDKASHFPLQNLPWGVFSLRDDGRKRIGTRLGDWVVDVAGLQTHGFFNGPQLRDTAVFDQPALNSFMAQGAAAWDEARATLQTLLAVDNPVLRDNAELRAQVFHPLANVIIHLPAAIGDYTDFYASEYHAANVGKMFRPDEPPLLPNWKQLPVGYHGRTSSIVLNGTEVLRPYGQILPPGAASPIFAATAELDFELEMGFFIGPGNALGQPIPVNRAEEHIFGLVLVNDWSARDIQRWEYRPLGPFLAKNFATSISPWVVPMAALRPFQAPGPAQDPTPLAYLQTTNTTYDIQLEVSLKSERMDTPLVISRSNMRHLYWNMAQMVAHHTSTGCNLRPGDLLATGTISGPTADSCGSLLELAWRGTRPLTLPTGETRIFLQDGDELTITGWAQGDGYRVGLGKVCGRVTAVTAVPV